MNRIFISYRRADAPDAVARLHARLVARLPNREVFYDHQSIDLGAEFPEVLRQRVTTAAVVLVVIGPGWVEELHRRRAADPSKIDHVREEVRLALSSGVQVIPVLVGGAAMPADTALADFPDLLPLCRLNAQTVRPDPDFDAHADRLIDHLERTGPPELVGSILTGRYKVQRPIGDGGMGEVYLAEQTEPVKRAVAVKLVKAGMDSKEVLARFDAERQALAVMDHPNVCKVLDAGVAPTGRPFFVMEYVKGVPITRYCDDHKLPPKERLALFVAVCQAVQHAHQKGIIHRDIKPANVLVEEIDGRPVPKVIDFGLAKALGRKLTDRTFAGTEYGRWVGTLEYSSPEQAEGQFHVDTLTDVYSLGVLLYELLAGSPPFTREELLATGEEAAIRVIREREPAAPSRKLSSSANLPAVAANRRLDPTALARSLRGDLDWIILKALEKARDRRYPTPTALADDIHRHLTDQPVSAGRPSARDRLRKFYRRNRPQVIAAGLVAAALVAGVIGTTIGFVRAEGRRAEAERASARTVDVLDLMVSETLGDAAFSLTPLTPEQKNTLTLALAHYRELAAEKGDDEATRERAANAEECVWLIEYRLALPAESDAGMETDAVGRILALGANGRWGETLEKRYRKVLALQQGVAADAPAVPAYRQDQARTHYRLGRLLDARGSHAEAEKEYRAAVALREKLADEFPGHFEYQIELADSFLGLGHLARHADNLAECLDWYGKAIDTRTRALRLRWDDTTSRGLRDAHWCRAKVHHRLGKHAEAAADWELAFFYSPQPEQPRLLAYRAISWANAGRMADAVQEVEGLRKVPGRTENDWYCFACVYSVASSKVADKKREYANTAMTMLREAVKAGFTDAAGLKTDAHLDPLRDRDDFKQLLADLEK